MDSLHSSTAYSLKKILNVKASVISYGKLFPSLQASGTFQAMTEISPVVPVDQLTKVNDDDKETKFLEVIVHKEALQYFGMQDATVGEKHGERFTE